MLLKLMALSIFKNEVLMTVLYGLPLYGLPEMRQMECVMQNLVGRSQG